MSTLWTQSLKHLESDLNDQQFHTWIRPLQAIEEESAIRLLAPSTFILDWVNKKLMTNIRQAIKKAAPINTPEILLEIGDYSFDALPEPEVTMPQPLQNKNKSTKKHSKPAVSNVKKSTIKHGLNASFTFDTFVEGKANQLAAAAARQVAENPGGSYNPFFIYGGVGLGKTHLMHAIGNQLLKDKPDARVVYLHSERFVADMVNALRHNKIDEFKRFYRSLDAILIDDIQFFSNKEQSQEEFFHTFNTLLEGNKQVILTSDRFPKEVDGLEDRLKSRFGWGLTI
ncbi:MAG: chromosomal replication initiator protein DnaA, partial [Thiomicrorhabdus sp.]|nr:chromosomal replication initiator protein DnaA [Thiomicrorhabdus sp.]